MLERTGKASSSGQLQIGGGPGRVGSAFCQSTVMSASACHLSTVGTKVVVCAISDGEAARKHDRCNSCSHHAGRAVRLRDHVQAAISSCARGHLSPHSDPSSCSSLPRPPTTSTPSQTQPHPSLPPSQFCCAADAGHCEHAGCRDRPAACTLDTEVDRSQCSTDAGSDGAGLQ